MSLSWSCRGVKYAVTSQRRVAPHEIPIAFPCRFEISRSLAEVNCAIVTNRNTNIQLLRKWLGFCDIEISWLQGCTKRLRCNITHCIATVNATVRITVTSKNLRRLFYHHYNVILPVIKCICEVIQSVNMSFVNMRQSVLKLLKLFINYAQR